MSNLLDLKDDKPDMSGTLTSFESEINPEWEAQMKGGANWFYWIAALSLVNSLAFIFQANFAFLAGLGFTQLFEAVVQLSIENGAPESLNVVAIIFDVIIVGIFALIGFYSNKGFTAPFLVGIIIYAIDAVLVLALGSYLTAGFHVFALFFIIRGYLAARKLKEHHRNTAFQAPPSPSESFRPVG